MRGHAPQGPSHHDAAPVALQAGIGTDRVDDGACGRVDPEQVRQERGEGGVVGQDSRDVDDRVFGHGQACGRHPRGGLRSEVRAAVAQRVVRVDEAIGEASRTGAALHVRHHEPASRPQRDRERTEPGVEIVEVVQARERGHGDGPSQRDRQRVERRVVDGVGRVGPPERSERGRRVDAHHLDASRQTRREVPAPARGIEAAPPRPDPEPRRDEVQLRQARVRPPPTGPVVAVRAGVEDVAVGRGAVGSLHAPSPPTLIGRSRTRHREEPVHALVAHASRGGHTARVAEHVAARLAAAGLRVDRLDLGGAAVAPTGDPDLVVVCSAVYHREHHPDVVAFLRHDADALEDRTVALVSVSLAAAGPEDDTTAIDDVDSLLAQVDVEPDHLALVAGAWTPSTWDDATRTGIGTAAWRAGLSFDVDRVFTDWAALDADIDRWLRALRADHSR